MKLYRRTRRNLLLVRITLLYLRCEWIAFRVNLNKNRAARLERRAFILERRADGLEERLSDWN